MKTQNRISSAQALIAGAMAMGLLLIPAWSASAEEVADADISSAINMEMWSDNAVSANDIDVTTQDGVVTLNGTVNSILEKDRAEALAAATVGVRAIVNLVEVQPVTPRDDSELAKAVENAWFADPVADTFELNASALDGVVTLTGTVQSYAEKNLSETVAKGVRGVKGIQNEIAVDHKSTRTDPEIQNEVKGRLENDIRVDDHLITVEVNQGNVTLSGSVGSLQEKNQAARDAWVYGVHSVHFDDLDIAWWARNKMRKKITDILRSDEEIKKAITAAFTYDPRVSSFNPAVEVSNGSVTLSGMVDNLKAKRAAEQDAKNTWGVWRVKNQLKVRPEIPANDVLEKRVVRALLKDPYIERYDVTVDAYFGTVYLWGDVNTSFEKYRAETVTESVKGVVDVVNNLDDDYRWVWKPDWEILEDITDQLTWSPFVSENDITVTVDNGIVTLSGTIPSWSELTDAEKNAYQGGAKDVENNLVVDHRYYGPYGPGYYAYPYYSYGQYF